MRERHEGQGRWGRGPHPLAAHGQAARQAPVVPQLPQHKGARRVAGWGWLSEVGPDRRFPCPLPEQVAQQLAGGSAGSSGGGSGGFGAGGPRLLLEVEDSAQVGGGGWQGRARRGGAWVVAGEGSVYLLVRGGWQWQVAGHLVGWQGTG